MVSQMQNFESNMNEKEVAKKLEELEGWIFNPAKNSIEREFIFKSYLKNIAFVNAVAWLANRENHHPDLEVTFNKCIVRLTTHDDNGLSEKDFNLASLINSL
jgi:4a-hydroxytetrahydrobiopterin dehydratase